MSFQCFEGRNGKYGLSAFLTYWAMMGCPEDKHAVPWLVATLFHALSAGRNDCQTNYVYLVLDIWQIFLEMAEVGYCFKESNWWYLLPMAKFKIFQAAIRKKGEFLKTCISFSPMTLTVFQKLKTFLTRLEAILMNVSFWNCLMKCVNSEICITQQTNSLQWPILDVTRSMQSVRSTNEF